MGNVFADFLQSAGVYDSIKIEESNIADLIALLAGDVKISTYCKVCKKERVFSMEPLTFFMEVQGEYIPKKLSDEVKSLQDMLYGSKAEYRRENGGEWQWKNWQIDEVGRLMTLKYVCSMDNEHHIDFAVLCDNNSFMKIGQYPSIADLTFPILGQYYKVMSKDDRKEMGRAVGLFTSGIGVGSYVYLRRILERLLLQARKEAGDAIDGEEFDNARVGEKIKMLSDYLPKLLTGNTVLYGVLSKGIHELSEEECLSFFPVVRDCIFMILDAWEEMRKKKEKEQAISAELSKIASNIK